MIPPTKLPSQKFLKECFRYERSTGKLFWKKRPTKHFTSDREFRRWNNRYAGDEAFKAVTSWGHRRGRVEGHSFLAHRVVWKIVTGNEPPDVIDHKDRNGQNNRWKNLREATTSQNCMNAIRKGVYFCKEHDRWRVHISISGKKTKIGDYKTEREAIEARQKAVREVYGEFAACA